MALEARSKGGGLWRTLLHPSSMRGATELVDIAYELAASEPDEVAGPRFAEAAKGRNGRAAQQCLEVLRARETAASERAYRIARAGIDGSPVAAPDRERLALIESLERMESVPIGEAWKRLVELEPRLADAAGQLEPLPEDEVGRLRWQQQLGKCISRWVGPEAETGAELLCTFRMRQLAIDHLMILAGAHELGTSETPHLELLRRRQEQLAGREGFTVEQLPGGRVRVTART